MNLEELLPLACGAGLGFSARPKVMAEVERGPLCCSPAARDSQEIPDPMQVLWPFWLGLLLGGRLQREDSFNDGVLTLCGKHLSCLTSGLLHFLLGEIPVCKLGDIFSQEAERKFLSSCD